MPDDTSKKGKADRDRINVNEQHEVKYWTESLGCTKEQLRDAIGKVGVMAQDVRAHLGR